MKDISRYRAPASKVEVELSNTWTTVKSNKNKIAAVNSSVERETLTWQRDAECKESTIIRARKKEEPFARVKEKTKGRKERKEKKCKRVEQAGGGTSEGVEVSSFFTTTEGEGALRGEGVALRVTRLRCARLHY